MRDTTLAGGVEAWPVYTSSSPGSSSSSAAAVRSIGLGLSAFLAFCLLFSSVMRRRRHRQRWERRQKAKAWEVVLAEPPSTECVPLEVRAGGVAGELVILGDDDAQFRPRVREGVTLHLADGRTCTLCPGTLLKCTFPGFTLLTDGGKGSVGVRAGTTFFIVAALPEGAGPRADGEGGGHPFRVGSAGPPVELLPVLDRYECRLDPAPVRRRRLARLLPVANHEAPPVWRPYLYPGIPIALVFALVQWGPGGLAIPLLAFVMIVLATVEDGLWTMSRGE